MRTPGKGRVMNARERVLATLDRQPVDRLPVDLWHTPEIGAVLRGYCGVESDLDVYRSLELDKIVWVFMSYKTGEGERRIAGRRRRRPARERCGACRSKEFRPARHTTTSSANRR